MFEAKLSNAGVMKKIVDAIKDLLKEASFDVSEASITLQAMDSSHVALVALKLESQGFETYRCDRSTNLGINLENFAKIVKCAGNDDTFTLRFQDDGDTIGLNFENSKGDRMSEYSLKLMDLDVEHLGIPEQDYACVVQMPASEFQRICRDLGQFGDSLSVSATKGEVSFSTSGDIGKGQIKLQPTGSTDDDRRVEIDLREPCNVSFAVKYLKEFTKATPLSSTVTLSISNDVPIVVEYKISMSVVDVDDEDEDEKPSKGKRKKATGPAEEIGYIRYYLAPKIDEEAEMA